MDDSDRRIHRRINFQHRGEALIEQRLVIEIVNLSVGGMGFKTSVPLEVDTICYLVLFQGNISVESLVMSCRKVPRRKLKYQIGVKFTKISAQLLEEVLEMEKHFNTRSPRIEVTLQEGKDGVAIIKFPKEVQADDHEEVMLLIQNFLDDGVKNFVMDFSDVTSMADQFLTKLGEFDEEIIFENGNLIMAHCSSNLLSMLTVSNLGSSIPIFETVNKAISAIKGNQIPVRDQ